MGKAHATGFYSPATFFAVGRILESDISKQQFFGNDRRVKCFVGYKYPTYIWFPAYMGMTAEVSAKLVLPSYSDDLCLVGVHCSVSFAHDNVGQRGRLKFWV